jgi:hypothetical protein
MNPIILVQGKPLRIREYSNQLFRGNGELRNGKWKANNHYTTQYNRYFTQKKNETRSYIKNKVKGYVKTWIPVEPLRLVDILDVTTRKGLRELIDIESLNMAFPLVNNKVYRYSENNSVSFDNKVLAEICQLRDENGNGIDGYIMDRQDGIATTTNGRNVLNFHSEIGLCKGSLHKLQLAKNGVNFYKFGTKQATKKRSINNESTGYGTPESHGILNSYASPTKKQKNNKTKNNRNKNQSTSTPLKPKKLFF